MLVVREIPFKVSSSAFIGLMWMVACSFSLVAQTLPSDTQTERTIGSITGRVVRENGQGVSNVVVYASRSSPIFQQRTASTDGEGNFTFDGIDRALYSLDVAAPGYIMPPRDPEAAPVYYRLGESATLSLIKGGVITGTVTSSSGAPVVQVPVRAIRVRDAYGQAPKYIGYQGQRLTDDRGVYRMYGLLPGTYVVSAGGGNSFGFNSPYNEDAPTYAPSATRDSAALVSVVAGEEATDVDIRYRGEIGHAISGTVTGVSDANSTSSLSVSLTQVVSGNPMESSFGFTPFSNKSFFFYGVADGDYDLNAQFSSGGGERVVAEPKRITVRGSDITGIELNLKPPGSISGRVVLGKSDIADCKNKRQPLFSETLIAARRSENEKPVEQPRFISFFASQTVPNPTGDFLLRNLAPGRYNFSARFFAKYWYLRSIVQQTGATVPAAANTSAVNRQIDLARNGVMLKFGESVSRVTVNLAEGAASLHGNLKLDTGQSVPTKFFVYLVPAEKESAEDVLRFFASEVGSDGAFALNNLAPGRYWALGQVTPNSEAQSEMKLRSPDEAEARDRLRHAAEAGNVLVELKPCQNMSGYQLPVSLVAPKN
jgi:hypothetical protein